MNQYDMHTHILPGIDDGAKDLQDALQLVKNCKATALRTLRLPPISIRTGKAFRIF